MEMSYWHNFDTLILMQHVFSALKLGELHWSSYVLRRHWKRFSTLVKVRRGGGGAACMEDQEATEFRWYTPLLSIPPVEITPDAAMVGWSGVAGGQNAPCSMFLPGNPSCCSLVFSWYVWWELRGAEAVRGWSIGTPKRRWRSACNWSPSCSLSLNPPKGESSARPASTLTWLHCGCVNGLITWEQGDESAWPPNCVEPIGCASVWFWFCIVENQGDTCHTR